MPRRRALAPVPMEPAFARHPCDFRSSRSRAASRASHIARAVSSGLPTCDAYSRGGTNQRSPSASIYQNVDHASSILRMQFSHRAKERHMRPSSASRSNRGNSLVVKALGLNDCCPSEKGLTSNVLCIVCGKMRKTFRACDAGSDGGRGKRCPERRGER